MKEKFLSFCKENIETLTAELLHTWFHEEALPELLKERKKELEDAGDDSSNMTMDVLLKEYNLTTLSLSTVLNWMEHFGFKYSPKQKTYYVDGHERPEIVDHQKKYCEQYLKDEIRCYRWIQLSENEVEKLENDTYNSFSRKSGYKYKTNDLTQMYEFHVDTHECLLPYSDLRPHGGNLSVRKKQEDKPLVIFGQDECIFKQFQMNTKRWILPDGTSALLPKNGGQGIMYSSFVSRDFGYGLEMNEEQLKIVNENRKNQTYKDEESAKAVQHGC